MFHVKHFRRRTIFAGLDFITVLVTFLGTLLLRIHVKIPVFEGRLPEFYANWLGNFAAYGAIMGAGYVACIYLLGIYDECQLGSPLAWAKKMFFPNVIVVGAAFSWLYIGQYFDFPRSVLVTFFIFNYIAAIFWRTLYFSTGHQDTSMVALVGSPEATQPILAELQTPPFCRHTQVLGVFSTEPLPTSLSAPNQLHGVPLFNLNYLEEFSKNHPAATIIVVPAQRESEETISQVLAMAGSDAPIYLFPSLFEILIGRLRHVRINDLPLVEIRLNRPAVTYSTLKRAFDISFALLLLVAAFLPMALIAATIRMSSRGSVVFVQERVGRDHKVFNMYKFRTMIEDAEANTGPVWSQENDPRVTPLGRFLRQTRLDEFLQLINIIKGDMSFVGPRPERPHFVGEFEKTIPGYRERLRVRPGVTGLAQVSGNYDSSPAIKLKYDLAYLVNQSFIIDIEILFKTARSVLTRRGR